MIFNINIYTTRRYIEYYTEGFYYRATNQLATLVCIIRILNRIINIYCIPHTKKFNASDLNNLVKKLINRFCNSAVQQVARVRFWYSKTERTKVVPGNVINRIYQSTYRKVNVNVFQRNLINITYRQVFCGQFPQESSSSSSTVYSFKKLETFSFNILFLEIYKIKFFEKTFFPSKFSFSNSINIFCVYKMRLNYPSINFILKLCPFPCCIL